MIADAGSLALVEIAARVLCGLALVTGGTATLEGTGQVDALRESTAWRTTLHAGRTLIYVAALM